MLTERVHALLPVGERIHLSSLPGALQKGNAVDVTKIKFKSMCGTFRSGVVQLDLQVSEGIRIPDGKRIVSWTESSSRNGCPGRRTEFTLPMQAIAVSDMIVVDDSTLEVHTEQEHDLEILSQFAPNHILVVAGIDGIDEAFVILSILSSTSLRLRSVRGSDPLSDHLVVDPRTQLADGNQAFLLVDPYMPGDLASLLSSAMTELSPEKIVYSLNAQTGTLQASPSSPQQASGWDARVSLDMDADTVWSADCLAARQGYVPTGVSFDSLVSSIATTSLSTGGRTAAIQSLNRSLALIHIDEDVLIQMLGSGRTISIPAGVYTRSAVASMLLSSSSALPSPGGETPQRFTLALASGESSVDLQASSGLDALKTGTGLDLVGSLPMLDGRYVGDTFPGPRPVRLLREYRIVQDDSEDQTLTLAPDMNVSVMNIIATSLSGSAITTLSVDRIPIVEQNDWVRIAGRGVFRVSACNVENKTFGVVGTFYSAIGVEDVAMPWTNFMDVIYARGSDSTGFSAAARACPSASVRGAVQDSPVDSLLYLSISGNIPIAQAFSGGAIRTAVSTTNRGTDGDDTSKTTMHREAAVFDPLSQPQSRSSGFISCLSEECAVLLSASGQEDRHGHSSSSSSAGAGRSMRPSAATASGYLVLSLKDAHGNPIVAGPRTVFVETELELARSSACPLVTATVIGRRLEGRTAC